MANVSIYAAFERMWQHIIAKLNDKADADSIDGLASEEYVSEKIAALDNIELDTTLSVEGKAADAKAVGDAISNLSGGNAENGEDGFSPIATITQTDSGAVISITDANGTTTATIADGVDYVLTEADKEEIADLVIASLGGQPVFGRVDSDNNIIITAALEAGTYTLKYEYADGTTADIGTMTVGGEDTATVIAITWNNCYKCSYTIGQSYELVADNSYCTSDVIEVEAGAKYTLTINNNETATKFRVVGANSSGVVTEIMIDNADIAVGDNTYTFTPSSGTTQIRLRTYVDAHVLATWVLTKE